MEKTKRRIIVVLAGIALSLIVLEVALRIVGSIYAHLSESDKVLNRDSRNTILCIGDSVTFGLGAPTELSYPAQLQKMLDKSDPEAKFIVINRGRPGQNSAQLLTRLERYLRDFKPKIVTILIGAQNHANYFGYRNYLEKAHNQERGFFLSLHDSLDRIRIYKFFRLIVRSETNTIQATTKPPSRQPPSQPDLEHYPDEQKPAQGLYTNEVEENNPPTSECVTGMQYKLKGDYDKALESILGVVEKQEVESECYYIAGSIYRERQQYEEAVTWFKKGIERDPAQFRNYEGIGKSYLDQNQLKEAIFWFKKGFENARYDTLHELCYVGINVAFEDAGDNRGAAEFFEKETKRKPVVNDYLHTLAGDYLLMVKNKGIDTAVHKWIQADIEQILDLCGQYNAKAVLQNYPYEPMIEHVYKRVARRRNVPFVDHQVTFEKFIKDGMRSEEYFIPDGHPNAKGYHLMANNLWKVLQEQVN